LVRDDLTTLPPVVALSYRARCLIAAKFAIAAGFITVLIDWRLIGYPFLLHGDAGH
jgi:hypothetical protein